MCEAIEGIREDGRKEGEIKTLLSLVKDKILSLQDAATRMGLSVADFKSETIKYGLEL